MTSQSNIIGTNNTTPGAATAPSTLLTDTSSTTGLTIRQGSGAPGTQVLLRVNNADNSTILEVTNGQHLCGYGIRIGAAAGVFVSPAQLVGSQNPPCLELPDGTASGWRLWGGTGAPGASTVGTSRVGDWYLRKDTPSTASQRIYVCTVAGAPGTWSALV